MLHASHDPRCDQILYTKSHQPAGEQANKREQRGLFQQKPSDLPRCHAQSFQTRKKAAILIHCHMNDTVDHQKTTQKHHQGRNVERCCMLTCHFHSGFVICQIGRVKNLIYALICHDLLRLLLQFLWLMEIDPHRDGCRIRVAGQKSGSTLRCHPGTGFREVCGACPPSAEGKIRTVPSSLAVCPLNRHRSTQFMKNPQRVHGKFIQSDFSRFLWQTPRCRNREDALCIVLIGYSQLDTANTHHLIGELAQSADPDRAFYIGMLR